MPASKIYVAPETGYTFNDTSTDYTITLNNLATTVGRHSDTLTLNANQRANRFRFFACVQFATAPVVGETVDFYITTYEGESAQGAGLHDDGTSDAALSSTDKLKNLIYVGSIVVDQAATAVDMCLDTTVEIDSRYIQVTVYNASADNLVATNDLNYIVLTPMPYEAQ